MSNFIGTYECKADAKGRLMLPAGLKNQILPILQEGFVLKRSVFHNCLELYPRAEWDTIMKTVGGLNRFNRKHDAFVRRFTAGLKLIDLDNTGRLLIPKDLISYAGISKDIVLASVNGLIEIWDKNRYEQVVNDPELDDADLAEEVLGGISNDNDNVS